MTHCTATAGEIATQQWALMLTVWMHTSAAHFPWKLLSKVQPCTACAVHRLVMLQTCPPCVHVGVPHLPWRADELSNARSYCHTLTLCKR